MKKIIFILLLFLLFTSCAKNSHSSIRESIVNDAKHYIGVKYKYGGTSPKGFDCSGFVQYIYAKNGISLPRTVSQMEHSLRKTRNPKKGDLVVFHNPKHVGIYIGNNKFIHSSSSRGVIISKLSEKWYRKRFNKFLTYF